MGVSDLKSRDWGASIKGNVGVGWRSRFRLHQVRPGACDYIAAIPVGGRLVGVCLSERGGFPSSSEAARRQTLGSRCGPSPIGCAIPYYDVARSSDTSLGSKIAS